MKKTVFILIIASCLLTTGCITTRSTARINQVELGMDRTEIQTLLGTPKFKNGNIEGEEWGYHKLVGEIAAPEEVLFLVTFNSDGKVVSYDTIKEYHYPHHF